MIRVLIIIFCLLITSVVKAESSPEDVIRELVGKMKATGSAAPIVEFIDWEKAYESFPSEQKQKLNIGSMEAMKAFYFKILKDPATTFHNKMLEEIENSDPMMRPKLQQNMAKFDEFFVAKQREVRQRLIETDFSVSKAEVNGSTAMVKLKQNFHGDIKEENILLQKSSRGLWLIPTADFASAAISTNPGANQQPYVQNPQHNQPSVNYQNKWAKPKSNVPRQSSPPSSGGGGFDF